MRHKQRTIRHTQHRYERWCVLMHAIKCFGEYTSIPMDHVGYSIWTCPVSLPKSLHIPHFHQDRAYGPLRAQHMFTAFPSQWHLRLKNGNVKCLVLFLYWSMLHTLPTLPSPKPAAEPRMSFSGGFLFRCYGYDNASSTSSRTKW